jgi:hypothetical protein
MVDETKLAQLETSASKAKWTTPSGFVYPAPREPSEYYKHKDAPSGTRCDDLRSPWIENLYHPLPVSSDDEGTRAGVPTFNTLPVKDMIFGGTNADGSINQEYFKSVHLVGDGLAKEKEEAKAKEHQEWLDKLVVDQNNIRFLAHGSTMGQGRSKPSGLDKTKDILDGPALSKPLRIIRAAKLPSGKAVPLQPVSVSIMCSDPYVGGATTCLMREKDTTQFLATTAEGEPKDFSIPLVTQLLVPKVNQHTTILKPRKELTVSERSGLLWKNMVIGTNQEKDL